MPLYLGFDCGIETLTAIVIEGEGPRRQPVFRQTLSIAAQPSPIAWADALDRMITTLATSAEVDVHQIRAIAGSTQQHATVYVNRYARDIWRRFDHTRPLAPQLAGAFSRQDAPVWIDATVGDQIHDFYDANPGVYAATTRIHTVGSFLASLLASGDAPIDFGDGSATGLMDLNAGDWSPQALDATAPGLRMRLPDLRPSSTIAGPLAAYWRDRYAMPPAAVVLWSGDIPNRLVGTGVVAEGTVAIAFGTSDTVLACAREPGPGTARVIASPTGVFARAVRFRNGSIARDFIRSTHDLDEPAFSRLLEQTPAGNHGMFMLPWLADETTPQVRHRGIRRFGFGPGHPALDARAVIEAQVMAMANHSLPFDSQLLARAQPLAQDRPAQRVVVTSDGIIGRPILQIVADVFAAETYQSEVVDAACLGAALRALHADRLHSEAPVAWSEVVAGFTDPRVADRVMPIAANVAIYRELRRRYADAEALHQDRPPIG